MRIYTRSGDRGETWVIGGRVAKDDPRVEAYGTIDELNAAVGLAAAMMAEEPGDVFADLLEELCEIQNELFDCGSDLSYAEPVPDKMKVHDGMVRLLEERIDRLSGEAPPIRRFILPGGSRLSACLHLCRTICRRAERRTVALSRTGPCPEEVLRYLNRLSDYFFVAARAVNARLGVPDREYIRSADVFGRGPAEPKSPAGTAGSPASAKRVDPPGSPASANPAEPSEQAASAKQPEPVNSADPMAPATSAGASEPANPAQGPNPPGSGEAGESR